MVITKNVDQNKGIVNATCRIVTRWEDTAASLEAELDEIDVKHKRPPWIEVELTTGNGKDTSIKLQPFEERAGTVLQGGSGQQRLFRQIEQFSDRGG